MKRLVAALSLFAIVGAAFAQAPFTIVSPRNYNPDTSAPLSREKVVLKFPKSSIPTGGYIGIYMGATQAGRVQNEKFVEATTLTTQGNYYTYTLDTKARQIPDGLYTVRAVLFVDYSDRPREISTSQVNIRVANQSSIKIPAKGLSLHYAFRAGQEWIYRVDVRTAVSTISGRQNSNGGRAAELPLEAETLRMVYAIDNTYRDGGALVRMQALPLKGKDALWVRTQGSDDVQKFYSYEMAPIFMRATNTGREIFGSMPDVYGSSQFVPLNVTNSSVRLLANFPLPTLPSEPKKPGDSWQTVFQDGVFKDSVKNVVEHFVSKNVARGEFLGVEYEHGHPCAKIHNTVASGMRTTAGMQLTQQGRDFSDDKISVDEVVYFALDIKKVIKAIRTITIDTHEVAGGSGFGTGGGGQDSGGGTKPGMAKPGFGGANWNGPARPDNQRGGNGLALPSAGPGGNNTTGPAGQGMRGNNTPAANAQYFRYTQQYILTLEE